MNRQNGMATLAVVSGVLLIAALFAISVASSGFADIKKTQNLVLDAKQRAEAKAGLDCAIAVFKQKELNPNDAGFDANFNVCETTSGSVIGADSLPAHWVLTSTSGYASSSILIKHIGGKHAAFKTTGDLVLEGGQDWTSVKGKYLGEKYECTAIIAGGSVSIDVGSSAAEFKTITPECADDYSTNVAANTPKITNDFESDILVNQNALTPDDPMDIFEELFGVPREQYQSVIDKHNPKQIHIANGDMASCGATIKNRVDEGDNESGVADFIWVKGDCLLDGITHVGTDEKPVTIVIQNGVVAVNGGVADFKGTIFQYADSSATGDMRMSSWGVEEDNDGNLSCTANAPVASLCSELINSEDMTKEKWESLAFFFRGAFTSSGSYMVDVPGGTSIMRGSFNGGAPDDPKGFLSGKLALVKESIHDF